MPTLSRLTRAVEFETVLKNGYRRSSANFAAQAIMSAGKETRLGLIASRKAAPRSVDRNRGKRLTREIFRDRSSSLPALDVVVRLKNNLRGANNPALRTELQGLLKSIAERARRSAVAADAAAASVVIMIEPILQTKTSV